MLDGHLFDTLAEIADCLRKKTTKPFGGIQVRQALASLPLRILNHGIACCHR